jgi:hypothetical protein
MFGHSVSPVRKQVESMDAITAIDHDVRRLEE